MKTLASFPALVAPCLVFENGDPTCSHVEVIAPCCGRKTAADSILDVRDAPGTVVAGGGHLPPKDHDWLCDGCRHRLYADPSNDWTRSRLYSAVGSDPEHVRMLHARELADQAAYWDHAHRGEHRPGDTLDAILVSLPVGDPHRRGPR